MAPISPYTTEEKVSYLLLNLFKGVPPSTSSTPTEEVTSRAISWAAAQMEMAYAEVGYVVPFADLGTETWPTHQSVYLDITNALGAAGFVGGHMLRPAPAIGPGKGQQFANLYQELFEKERQAIIKGKGKRFRAAYYAGTPAEQMLADPEGPRTNFGEQVYDPASYVGIWGLMDLFDEFREDIDDLDLDWNYMTAWRTAAQL